MIQDKITILRPGKSVSELIEHIEKERAAGHVKMLLSLWIDEEGCINCHHSELISTTRALGALELLKHRILES